MYNTKIITIFIINPNVMREACKDLSYGNNSMGRMGRLNEHGPGWMGHGDEAPLPTWVVVLRELLEKARENGEDGVESREKRPYINLDPGPYLTGGSDILEGSD